MTAGFEQFGNVGAFELVETEELCYEVEDFEAMGVDPYSPTAAKPGSDDKVKTLAARYAAGLPLWHTEDCYDHGLGKFVALDD